MSSTQLQNLSNQFNSLLTQYTNTYEEYINLVASNDTSFTSVPNSVFVGKSNINTLKNYTLDACQRACSSNSSCSGATFNNNLDACTLSSGSGNIIPASHSSAIVKQAMYYSYQLQQLNLQLTKVNQEMMRISSSSYNQYQQNQQKTQQQEQNLQNNYQTLLQEREQIDMMIRQFQTIDSAYENGSINVTSNYYNYIVLLLIVIFLIFLLMRFSLFDEQRGGGSAFTNNYLYIFIILSVIIIFNSFIKK
jgi:predicted PurR-regulated permease PerM